MFSTTNVLEKWNMEGFERISSYEQYPEEKSPLSFSSFKKNWSTFTQDYSTWLQTYTSHRVHIIQIPRAAPSFMGIWTIWSPLKIHCFTCMLFKTCWSRLIYTKLSSHRSFVRNMYVITMAWRCISPWSFHWSLQRRREMDIFQPPRFVCHSSIHWCQFLIVVIFYHKKYESAKSKMFDFFSFWQKIKT